AFDGHCLRDALDEPGERVRAIGEHHVMLQNVVEIDVQTTVVIEDGDRSALIDAGPKVRFHAMRVALAGCLEHCWGPFLSSADCARQPSRRAATTLRLRGRVRSIAAARGLPACPAPHPGQYRPRLPLGFGARICRNASSRGR